MLMMATTDLEAGIHRMINTVQMRFDLSSIDRIACEQFVRTAKKGTQDDIHKVHVCRLWDRARKTGTVLERTLQELSRMMQQNDTMGLFKDLTAIRTMFAKQHSVTAAFAQEADTVSDAVERTTVQLQQLSSIMSRSVMEDDTIESDDALLAELMGEEIPVAAVAAAAAGGAAGGAVPRLQRAAA